MKLRIALLAAMTMLFGGAVMAQLALTAGPKSVTPILSGVYIVRVTHVCQATLAVTQNQGPNVVTSVTVANSGDANQNIGTVTFDHATGHATLSADSIDGSPLLMTTNDSLPLGTVLADTPPPVPPTAFPYSNTSTSFTISTNSGDVTYHAFYASVNASTKIPQFMIFGGIEEPGCTTTGIAIHQ